MSDDEELDEEMLLDGDDEPEMDEEEEEMELLRSEGIVDALEENIRRDFALKYGTKTVHEKSAHLGIRNYKCPLCEKNLSSPSALYTHKKTHGDKVFNCEFCTKTFTLKNYLKLHVKQVHEQNERKHVCTYCQKSFAYAGSLQARARVSSESPINVETDSDGTFEDSPKKLAMLGNYEPSAFSVPVVSPAPLKLNLPFSALPRPLPLQIPPPNYGPLSASKPPFSADCSLPEAFAFQPCLQSATAQLADQLLPPTPTSSLPTPTLPPLDPALLSTLLSAGGPNALPQLQLLLQLQQQSQTEALVQQLLLGSLPSPLLQLPQLNPFTLPPLPTSTNSIIALAVIVLVVWTIVRRRQEVEKRQIFLRFPDEEAHFNFTILPTSLNCGGLKQLVMVQSAPSSFDSRIGIRHTWAAQDESVLIQNGRSLVLFLLGSTNDPKIQKDIEDEASLHNDIVQYSAIDSYRALVYKSLVMLKFHDVYCPAGILIKADDDVLMDIDNVQRRLDATGFLGTPFIAGLVAAEGSTPIIRQQNHKWYVSEDKLPGSYYPIYAKGLAYIISREATPILLASTVKWPLIPIEDAYVTGLLAKNTSIKYVYMDGYIYDSAVPKKFHCFDGHITLICAHAFKGETRLRDGWELMKQLKC
ncbi:unnamed protein product, partial [Mesorhabditis spiculigera]